MAAECRLTASSCPRYRGSTRRWLAAVSGSAKAVMLQCFRRAGPERRRFCSPLRRNTFHRLCCCPVLPKTLQSVEIPTPRVGRRFGVGRRGLRWGWVCPGQNVRLVSCHLWSGVVSDPRYLATMRWYARPEGDSHQLRVAPLRDSTTPSDRPPDGETLRHHHRVKRRGPIPHHREVEQRPTR